MYSVSITNHAERDLKKLDRQIKNRITRQSSHWRTILGRPAVSKFKAKKGFGEYALVTGVSAIWWMTPQARLSFSESRIEVSSTHKHGWSVIAGNRLLLPVE